MRTLATWGWPATGRNRNTCAAALLQVFWVSCTSTAVEAPGTSMHRPLCMATAVLLNVVRLGRDCAASGGQAQASRATVNSRRAWLLIGRLRGAQWS